MTKTTTTQSLATIVFESEEAARAAAEAQAKAVEAARKADEARQRAEREREQANRRYLDQLDARGCP